MRKEIINHDCFFGLPSCGYGYESARMCFITCPSDDGNTLVIDEIKKLLVERNYEAFVAVERSSHAKLVFCSKVCSRIIQSHFCIVLLNESQSQGGYSYPNPNVHYEYGMMCALRKLVIPIVNSKTKLAFNVSPLDTVHFTNRTLRKEIGKAIDDAIALYSSGQSNTASRPPDVDVIRYMSIEGRVLISVDSDFNRLIYDLGSRLGYYLFMGADVAYFLDATSFDENRIAFDVSLLFRNINAQIVRMQKICLSPGDATGPRQFLSQMEDIELVILIDSATNKKRVNEFIKTQRLSIANFKKRVRFVTREEVNAAVLAVTPSL